MLLARAALRPVPRYAVVSPPFIEAVEQEFVGDSSLARRLDRAFDEVDEQQPEIARFLSDELESVRDDTAEALGHFLGVAIFRAFRAAFGKRLGVASRDALRATAATFDVDEEMRRANAAEALETDDVVAMAQPHLVQFVRDQLNAALDADFEGESPDVDLDSVSTVYRIALVLIMTLSHCVGVPSGAPQIAAH